MRNLFVVECSLILTVICIVFPDKSVMICIVFPDKSILDDEEDNENNDYSGAADVIFSSRSHKNIQWLIIRYLILRYSYKFYNLHVYVIYILFNTCIFKAFKIKRYTATSSNVGYRIFKENFHYCFKLELNLENI